MAASVAGVVAGVLLVVDRWGPKPDFTVNDWRREADEVCDRSVNFANTVKVWSSVEQLAAAQNSLPKDQFETLRETVANDVAALASRVRGFKTDLDDIDRPSRHGEEVDRLIESINYGTVLIFQFSSDVREAVDPAEVAVLYGEFLQKINKPGVEQLELVKKLGAKQCYLNMQ